MGEIVLIRTVSPLLRHQRHFFQGPFGILLQTGSDDTTCAMCKQHGVHVVVSCTDTCNCSDFEYKIFDQRSGFLFTPPFLKIFLDLFSRLKVT